MTDYPTDPLKWKLIYREFGMHVTREIGEYNCPAEGKVAAVAYVGCELTWAVSPEGHVFSIVPYDEDAPMPSANLQLRNPYYDFWIKEGDYPLTSGKP